MQAHIPVRKRDPLGGTGTCTVEGCDQPAVTHTWCGTHLSRWRKTGDVQAGAPPRVGYLYLVQAATGDGLVKIGRTRDIDARMKALSIGSPVPLRVVHLIPQAGYLEKELHELFSAHRRHGEWFDPHPDILGWFRTASEAPSEVLRASS